MSPTGETSDPELTGQKDDEEASGSLGRWIAISLAAITFLGAGIAIVQTDASVNESNTARETTRTAVAALRAGVVNEAGVLLEQDIAAERNSLQRKQAFIARQNGNVAGPLSLAELASIIPQGGELPGARTAAELRRLSFNSEFLSLSQSGLAETRVTWNDRSTQYTTAIAVLAFALFLVGFSLVLRGPRRRIFFGFGLAVALLVVGAAVYIYLLPIPRTSESAIAATARASVESDLGNQERAIDLLDRAIEIDGDYAEPYARRAVARALAANPDFRVTGAVVSSDQQLGKSVEDARRALELDEGQDFLALSFLATIALHAGEYERAISAAAEAIGINSEIPDIRLTKSAAELGLGEFEAAAESLDAARALLSGSDPSERTRGLIAGYLTKLEQVAHRTPARTQRVRRIEREVIANETAFTLDREVTGTAPPVGSVSVDELSYRDGSFRLRARWRDLPPGTELTLVGFERPAPGSAWVQPRDLALFRSLSGSGEQVGEVPIERACTPVEVRVDAYLDGAFVESATGPGGRATC
jgi:tetratricopeptide (TPR) repeat protein